MSTEEFIGGVFLPNQSLYYAILLLSIAVYFVVFRIYYISIIDPAFLEVIGSIFGFSVVLLLFFTDNIAWYYFESYLFSQIIFWCGFIYISNKKIFVSNTFLKVRDEDNMLKIIFLVSLIFYVLTTILGYILLGIPILAESRLDITANAQGGMGVLSRFSYLSVVCIYCSFHFYYRKHKDIVVKLMQIVTVVIFCLASILSGSKSAFLEIAFVFFCFVILNKNKKLFLTLKKKQYYFITLGIVVAMSVIMISTGGNLESSFLALLFRFVGSGDVYWLGYPNGMLEDVPYQNPFIVLFQSFLGFFRIVPHSEFPEPIGYTLSSFFYDKTSLTGANARHNIFGYVYCGFYGGLIFSFVLGCLVGFIRNVFLKIEKQGTFCKIFMLLLYISVFSLEVDPTLFFSYLIDLFITLPVVLLVSIILYINHVSNSNSTFNV